MLGQKGFGEFNRCLCIYKLSYITSATLCFLRIAVADGPRLFHIAQRFGTGLGWRFVDRQSGQGGLSPVLRLVPGLPRLRVSASGEVLGVFPLRHRPGAGGRRDPRLASVRSIDRSRGLAPSLVGLLGWAE